MKLREIVESIEKTCPLSAALDWDNSGLMVGDLESEIHSVMVALDATDEVIDAAIANKVSLIVTHHPLIFGKINSVRADDIVGRRILKMIKNNIACYSAHTNFDVKVMANLAASMLGLEAPEVLEVTGVDENGNLEGVGRVSDVYESNASVWIDKLKASFELDNVIVYGDANKIVKRIAISPGSGKGMAKYAIEKNADMLITGDIGHHDGIDAVAMGLTVVDASHYGLEYIFIDYMARYIERESNDVRVYTCRAGVPFKIM